MIGRRGGRAIHWAEAFGLSALVHVGFVFFALDFVNDLQLFAPPDDQAPPDLLVTSLVLDAQTLAAATQAPGAEGETGEGDVPDTETPPEIEPETLEPAAPEPETAEAAEPEEALEPEAPDAPEPETAEAVEPEPLTPEPVEPEPVTAEPVTPDTAEPEAEPLQPVEIARPAPVSPLRPDEDSIAALAPVVGGAPERLTGTSPAATPTTVAPSTTVSTQRVAPVVTRPRVTPPAPRRMIEPPAPGSPAAVVSELVAKIRAGVSDACLVAMPQQARDGSPELVMLAADETSISEFAENVLSDIDPRPGQRGVLIDPRQCAAATFVRQNASYPAFRLSLGLTTDALPSGEELTGAVGRAAGAYVSLLLIDDNGVVQDLGNYLTFAGGEARFSVPMRRDGPNRDTSQMLVALATSGRPATLDAENGQLAKDFFPALEAEIGTNVPMVMIPFDVR